MIITQTPLRISFIGGGTDIPAYYRNFDGGMVVSATIDKYIYCIVKRRFDEKIRLGYSKTELVDSVDELGHELIREAMKVVGIESQVEISTLADIPSTGSGLGSSSAVTVGILNALYNYAGTSATKKQLAEETCSIELMQCKKPIGKQDQYAAAYGGLNKICFDYQFDADIDIVKVNPIEISGNTKRKLDANLMLFYTGLRRKSEDILAGQKAEMGEHLQEMDEMKSWTNTLSNTLKGRDLNMFGYILDRGWGLKKSFNNSISNTQIDGMYQKAKDAGATGGKICGAGAGGFLLLYVPYEKQENVRRALSDYRELPFNLEDNGTRVIFNND